MSFNKTDQRKRYKLRNNYIPPISTSGCLEDYIYALKIEASKLKPRKTRNNLSQRQRIALRKLSKRKDIHIDKPTAEYLLPPPMVRTQEMYFLKKIHKNPPTARPIVSGCDGPTERISAYLDHWLQPLAKSLPSYIKDTKEFIKYIESTKLPKDCILCTLDVSSLYTNIPTEDGIYAALQAIENWENKDPLCPPTSWLRKLLELILYKNVF